MVRRSAVCNAVSFDIGCQLLHANEITNRFTREEIVVANDVLHRQLQHGNVLRHVEPLPISVGRRMRQHAFEPRHRPAHLVIDFADRQV